MKKECGPGFLIQEETLLMHRNDSNAVFQKVCGCNMHANRTANKKCPQSFEDDAEDKLVDDNRKRVSKCRYSAMP
jgi:hypothetical protein